VNMLRTDLSKEASANTAHAAAPDQGRQTADKDQEPAAPFHPG
jgi:hypothetical protein